MAITTKIMKRPKMGFWENIYLPEIVRGVMITSGHFWKNLFFHIMHALGFFKAVRAAVTIMYPEKNRPLSPRLRTRHRLTQRSDGSPRCVACMMCETVCPAACIYIVAEEHPDPTIEKRPSSFDIDLGKCVYCGFCVEACPPGLDCSLRSLVRAILLRIPPPICSGLLISSILPDWH